MSVKYRPVYQRLWSDRRFLACGDDARLLFLFLLTCPSLPIPGVIIGGDAALAEQIGWTVERFQERFRELVTNGLEVAREGRIVWLKNALKYQPPANPNMIKGWSKTWDDVPEGQLRSELWEALKIACKSWSVLFSKLFAQPSRPRIDNGSANGSSNGSDTGFSHKHQHEHKHQHDLEEEERAAATIDSDTAAALAKQTWARVSDARVAIATKHGLTGVLPLVVTPSRGHNGMAELKARIRDEGAEAARVCDHVVAGLVEQAELAGDVEWLSEKAFTPGGWRTARNAVLGKPKRAGPRGSAARAGDRSPVLQNLLNDIATLEAREKANGS